MGTHNEVAKSDLESINTGFIVGMKEGTPTPILSVDMSSIPEDFDMDKFAEEWRNFSSQIIYKEPDNYIYATSDLCKELIASGISGKYNLSIIEHPLLDAGQMMIAGPIVEKHQEKRKVHLLQAIEWCGYEVENIEEIIQGKGKLEIKYKRFGNEQMEYFLFDKENGLYLLMTQSPYPFGEIKIRKNEPGNFCIVNEGYFDK